MSPPSTLRPRAEGALYSMVMLLPPRLMLVSADGLLAFWVTWRLPVAAVRIATAARAAAGKVKIFICVLGWQVNTFHFSTLVDCEATACQRPSRLMKTSIQANLPLLSLPCTIAVVPK